MLARDGWVRLVKGKDVLRMSKGHGGAMRVSRGKESVPQGLLCNPARPAGRTHGSSKHLVPPSPALSTNLTWASMA